MKYGILVPCLTACILLCGTALTAADPVTQAPKCASEDTLWQESDGTCSAPESNITPTVPGGSLLRLLTLQNDLNSATYLQQATGGQTKTAVDTTTPTIVYLFWGKGCPHCKEEMVFLDGVKADHPDLVVKEYEVWHNRENAGFMAAILQARGVQSSGVPVTLVGDNLFSGFTPQTRDAIMTAISRCMSVSCGDPTERLGRTGYNGMTVPPLPSPSKLLPAVAEAKKEASIHIPVFGTVNAHDTSLPLLTLLIAGMDSFNPCAFFVLLSLLGLLVHARSRNKMFLIGGIFVFFSGFIYFLFMAAWLNLFLVMGNVAVVTTVAGVVSVCIAGANIKEFFLFKQGLSLTIPDSAKPKLFNRMRRLLRSTSLISIMVGTSVLAVVANFYELLCTAGFPMLFTRILTMNNLSPAVYYLYLILYNIVYVVPLFLIVLGFTFTLGKRQLSEWEGRVLKLVSGSMMLGLGLVLLVNPALLNSVAVSLAILITALVTSLLVATITKHRWPWRSS